MKKVLFIIILISHLCINSFALSFDDEDTNAFQDYDGTSIPFLFQTGIRLYNQFRLVSFDIQPFIGLNLMSGTIVTKISDIDSGG